MRPEIKYPSYTLRSLVYCTDIEDVPQQLVEAALDTVIDKYRDELVDIALRLDEQLKERLRIIEAEKRAREAQKEREVRYKRAVELMDTMVSLTPPLCMSHCMAVMKQVYPELQSDEVIRMFRQAAWKRAFGEDGV